jgi:hypothetical protein
MKYVNIFCWQNAEVVNVESGGTYSNRCALEDSAEIYKLMLWYGVY